MQDRYAGDVGDYGKIGLLKCLQAHGFSIGVNWYRVPMLDVEKKKDGSFKKVHYKQKGIAYGQSSAMPFLFKATSQELWGKLASSHVSLCMSR